MRLKLLGSDTVIKGFNINNAAKAVLALQNQGTMMDPTGVLYFNDIDNKTFQSVCSMLQQRVYLDIHDLNSLLDPWFWGTDIENGDVKRIRLLVADDYMDEKSEDIILFKALAPYIEDGSYMIFAREDYNGLVNHNLLKMEFYLGRVHVMECNAISFTDCLPGSEYDCFNDIKTLIVGTATTNAQPTTSQGYFNYTYNLNNIVPKTIPVQTVPSPQITVPPKTAKYGGFCKKCMLYDDYAEQDAFGQVLCYKCNGA